MNKMKFDDMFKYSIEYLKTERLRSYLTMLGIIIGIATIFILIGISNGLKSNVKSQLDSFGSNNIMVIPINIENRGINFMGAGQRATSGKLFEKDYNRIKNIPGIDNSARLIYSKSTISFRDKMFSAPVFASDPQTFDMWIDYLKIESGRYFNGNEKYVVVLGNDAANKLFGNYKIRVNNYILINGIRFRVVGILEKIGTSLSKMDDSAIYIPYIAGRTLFRENLLPDEINLIFIKSKIDSESLKPLIENKLLNSHHLKYEDKDFSVITSKQISEIVGTVMGLITTFILIIAVISAIIGGVGIANTMFMSVLNRTREIGVLKSIGATNKEILILFLIEGLILGVFGGIFGILLGISILGAITMFFKVRVILAVYDILLIFTFTILVSLSASILPAYRASKLSPISALKY